MAQQSAASTRRLGGRATACFGRDDAGDAPVDRESAWRRAARAAMIGLSVAIPLCALALTIQRHVGILTWQRVLAVLGGLSLALAVLALSTRRLPR